MMFTYYLRKTLRDKAYIFWSLAFPILLMTCFSVTFMGPAKGEVDFNPVETTMICTDSGDSAFACEEGELVWIDPAEIAHLPIWPGDKIFFRLLGEREDVFSLKLHYVRDELVAAAVDGRPIDVQAALHSNAFK